MCMLGVRLGLPQQALHNAGVACRTCDASDACSSHRCRDVSAVASVPRWHPPLLGGQALEQRRVDALAAQRAASAALQHALHVPQVGGERGQAEQHLHVNKQSWRSGHWAAPHHVGTATQQRQGSPHPPVHSH